MSGQVYLVCREVCHVSGCVCIVCDGCSVMGDGCCVMGVV